MRQEFKDGTAAIDRGLDLIKQGVKMIAIDNARYDSGATIPMAHTPRDFSEDAAALAELRRLTRPAKEFLEHHLNNTINTVGLYCELGMTQKARECVWQLADILEQIGEVGHGHGAGVEAAGAAAVHEAVEGQARREDLAAGA
jgi:hypothetical protein